MIRCCSLMAAFLGVLVLVGGCQQGETKPEGTKEVGTGEVVQRIGEPKEPGPKDGYEPEDVVKVGDVNDVKAGEPNEVEPAEGQPAEDQIVTVEPNQVRIDVTEPNVVEPNTVEPIIIEPNEAEAAEPNAAVVAEPNVVETSEPNAVKPGAVGQTEPNVTEPNEATVVEPNEPKASSATVFHDKCAEILKAFVLKDGRVDYNALRRKRVDLKKLLDAFDELDPAEYNSWGEKDKIAFWINAYNIQMLDIILRNYPIKSSRWLRLMWLPTDIRHIRGIRTDYKFMVMDEEFTIARVEGRFFKRAFNEPRLFLALNYASVSGPPLRDEPYYGDRLDKQLDDQSEKFISSTRGFGIDRDRKVVYLSALFKDTWHGKEFVKRFGTDKKFKEQKAETRAVLNFISNYISEDDESFLEVENYSVQYMKYDWRLNDTSFIE